MLLVRMKKLIAEFLLNVRLVVLADARVHAIRFFAAPTQWVSYAGHSSCLSTVCFCRSCCNAGVKSVLLRQSQVIAKGLSFVAVVEEVAFA